MDPQQPNAAHCTSSRVLAAVGMGAVGIYGAKVLINVFGPRPQFTMRSPGVPLDSEEFVQFLSLLTDGTRRRSRLKRLKNGDEFYPEELRAIESARHAINMEYYEFSEGDVSRRILAALCEKARAGVDVRMVIDAAGSIHTSNHYFDSLREAGGKMRWYHPLRWDTWPKFNQRTHRKLLIVDGQIGFIGGAGIANRFPPWIGFWGAQSGLKADVARTRTSLRSVRIRGPLCHRLLWRWMLGDKRLECGNLA